MSDTAKRPDKGAASNGVPHRRRQARLDAQIESKVSQTPIPGGRDANACGKIFKKLKDKLNDDIENVKADRPVAAAVEGEATAKPTKAAARREWGLLCEAVIKEKETNVKNGEDVEGEV